MNGLSHMELFIAIIQTDCSDVSFIYVMRTNIKLAKQAILQLAKLVAKYPTR